MHRLLEATKENLLWLERPKDITGSDLSSKMWQCDSPCSFSYGLSAVKLGRIQEPR